MRSKAKMKLSLLASMGVSLLAVASASISTFAWFQAQADVTITTSGASTTITVTKPDDVDITATIHNCSLNDSISSYKGYYQGTPTYANFDWANEATSSQKNFPAWPGYKKTFGIKLVSTCANSFSVNLFIDAFSSVTKANRHRKAEGSEASDGVINFAKAVNVYFGYSSSAAYNMDTSTDKFQWSYTNQISKSTAKQGSISSGTNVTSYFFYTIEYDDSPSSHYVEYTNSNYNVVYTENSKPTSNSEGNRYFKYVSGSGNSNCYDGLSFTITTLKLEVA